MSEWRHIKLSVLLHAIDNDHCYLLSIPYCFPNLNAHTFRTLEEFPARWRDRPDLTIPIGGLRRCLILTFCYENHLNLVNDTTLPLWRALGYRTRRAMSKCAYGEIHIENAPSPFKRISEFRNYGGTPLQDVDNARWRKTWYCD